MSCKIKEHSPTLGPSPQPPFPPTHTRGEKKTKQQSDWLKAGFDPKVHGIFTNRIYQLATITTICHRGTYVTYFLSECVGFFPFKSESQSKPMYLMSIILFTHHLIKLFHLFPLFLHLQTELNLHPSV